MRKFSKPGVNQAVMTGMVMLLYYSIVTSNWFDVLIPKTIFGESIRMFLFYFFWALVITFVYSMFGIFKKDYTESKFVKGTGNFKGSSGPYGSGLKGIGGHVLNKDKD